MVFSVAAVIPSLAVDWFLKKEKRRSLYRLPSYLPRLLALPFSCRGGNEKPYACI